MRWLIAILELGLMCWFVAIGCEAMVQRAVGMRSPFKLAEFHHGFIGLALVIIGWALDSVTGQLVQLLGIVVTSDDLYQHQLQTLHGLTEYRSPLHELFARYLWPLPFVPAVVRFLDRWWFAGVVLGLLALWRRARIARALGAHVSAGGFCIDCGHRVESFEGLQCCPACGGNGIPCADRDQLDLKINWQELRVLVVWAENWQRLHPAECKKTVYAIARRILAQHPSRGPLTRAAEVGELVKHFDGVQLSSPDLRRDVAPEQTGEEPGLIPQPDDDSEEQADRLEEPPL